jgi:hypothetical protein
MSRFGNNETCFFNSFMKGNITMAKIEQVFPEGFENEAGLFRPLVVNGIVFHTPAWIYWREYPKKAPKHPGAWLFKPSRVHFPGCGQKEFSVKNGVLAAFQDACEARNDYWPLNDEAELIFHVNEKSEKSVMLQAPGVIAMLMYERVHYLRASAGKLHTQYFPFTGEIGGPSYEKVLVQAKEARERLKEAAKADARQRNLEQIKLLLGQA